MKLLSDRRGAAALEFALTIPLLVVMLMGIIQYSVLMFTYNAMLNGARSGARTLAISAGSTDAIATAVKGSLPAWVDPDSVTVVSRDIAQTGSNQVDTTVTMSGEAATIVSFLPMPSTIQARAVMVKES